MLVKRNLPKNIISSDIWMFEHEFNKTLSESKPMVLSNVISNSQSQIVFTSSGKKAVPNLQKAAFLLKTKMLFFFSTSFSNKSLILVTDSWSNGFFHWLLDVLPKIVTLKEKSDNKKIILHHFFWKSFYRESLELLGYKAEDFYLFNTRFLFSTQLIIPSHIGSSGNYNEACIKELRAAFLKATKCDENIPHKNIYISRNKTARRRLVNETAILPILQQNNFETIYAEDLSLKDQIKLFSEAKIVLGVHGAGLTNMLFMAPNTKVLELRFENDNCNNCYYSLASALNINYYYCLGTKINSDLYVSEDAISKAIEEITSNL